MEPQSPQDQQISLLRKLEELHRLVRELVGGVVDLSLLLPLDLNDKNLVDRAARQACAIALRSESAALVAGVICTIIEGASRAAK